MMISAPMIYWWTGTAVIDGTVDDMLAWLGPYLASGMVFTGFLARNTVFPIMTDVTHLLAAPAIVRTVAIGLVKPWGHPFKVTAKGVSTDGVTVQWGLLAPFAIVAIATVLGMLANMSPYSPLNGTRGYAINVFWSIFNVAVLSIACAVCVELPKRRGDERFASGERTTAVLPGEAPRECVVLDMSLGGARLSCVGGWGAAVGSGELALDRGAFRLPFAAVRLDPEGALAIRFKHSDASRRALTRKLFTGGYDNEVDQVSVIGTLVGAARKVFR
jgi:cellulose synthase (UDP-forming)